MVKIPWRLIVAFVLLYGYAFTTWFIEANNPSITKVFIAGAPAPVWYCWLGALYILNLLVAFIVASG